MTKLNLPTNSTDRPLLGIAWMLATMFWFVTLDSTAKYLMQSYPVVQVIWARFFFHLVFVAVLMGRQLPVATKCCSAIYRMAGPWPVPR